MNPFNKIWRWLRSLGQRRAVKQEIDEELRFHIEQRKLFGKLLQFGFRHRISFGFETTAVLCRQIANRKSQI
jgi:hypothetical protein